MRRLPSLAPLFVLTLLFDVTWSPEIHASSSLADGNGDGMSTRLFRAAVDSKGFFTVNGTDVLGRGDVAFGLVLDGGFGLLRLRDKVNGTNVDRTSTELISSQMHGVLFVGWSPLKSLSIGLGLPVDVVAGDAQPAGQNPIGVSNQKTDVNAFFGGSWTFNVKYRILRVEDQPVGLAVIGAVDVPMSSDARLGYASDPTVSFHPTIALEKRFGAEQRLRFGVNVGASLMGGGGSKVGDLASGDPTSALQHGDLGRFGAALSYRASDSLDLVGETYGSYLFKNDAGKTAGLSAESVGGIKVFVERNSYLFLGGGVGYLKGYQAADERGFLGFVFEPSIGDRDGDGLKDDVDQCPDDPEDRDGFQDEDGCPDPDNDKDDILDRDDACPNDPETKNGIADEDGCPDGLDGDRDHDGFKDSKDKCPDEPEDKDGFEDGDGCPDPDNDKDGILDKDDQCPNDPEDKDGFQDEDGCPDPDNDKDGILDKDDVCPNKPENYNGFEDGDGCPDTPVIPGTTDLVLLEPIQFEYDSAKIAQKSLPILDAVAKLINDHKEYVLLEVEGHADERGDDLYNLGLTKARVKSVVAALVQRKVDPKKLVSQGYGEYCPVDPSHTDEAWAKNRRVDFKIVKTTDGPTNAPLGCDNAVKHGVKPPL